MLNRKKNILNSPILPRFSRTNSNAFGFSLVEMLVVAPIVILMIGIFVSAIVAMTGDVLSTRSANALSYNVQDALDRIDADIKSSGAILATNDIVLTSPQGYDNATGVFKNADATNGTMLILKTYATSNNPLNSTQNLVYISGLPNSCSSAQVSQNKPLMLNVVYFVKNSTLWRRVIAPSNYATAGCVSGAVGAPWQQPSCAPVISGAMCKTQDEKLVDGITNDGFVVNYYTTSSSTTPNSIAVDSSQSDSIRLAALQTTSTVSVTINGASTTAGRNTSQSGTIREVSANNIAPIIPSSCNAILNAGGSVGDGTYSIKPTTTTVQAYCDMQNGGWTRLNNNISTSTTAFNGSDLLVTNNVNGNVCGTPGCAFTINKISIQHTNVKIIMTRTTSIVQCAGLVGVGAQGSSYWSGSSWVSYAMCNWSDGVFANSTATNMAGLKMLWKIEGTKAANGEIKIKSECSDASDTGQIQVTAWVK